MYNKIMVPVDLAHLERIEKALLCAADLGRHYGIPVCYVGVTGEAPGEAAHNPQEYADRLASFGQEQATRHKLTAETVVQVAHDPAIELPDILSRAIADTGADLVVMASHLPGLSDHIFSSNAGAVASHAPVSVFVVR